MTGPRAQGTFVLGQGGSGPNGGRRGAVSCSSGHGSARPIPRRRCGDSVAAAGGVRRSGSEGGTDR